MRRADDAVDFWEGLAGATWLARGPLNALPRQMTRLRPSARRAGSTGHMCDRQRILASQLPAHLHHLSYSEGRDVRAPSDVALTVWRFGEVPVENLAGRIQSGG